MLLLHSEPAFVLGLPMVWSLWGNPEMARYREMSTLPAGYILHESDIRKQQWVTGFH